jgi:hypothetical protein
MHRRARFARHALSCGSPFRTLYAASWAEVAIASRGIDAYHFVAWKIEGNWLEIITQCLQSSCSRRSHVRTEFVLSGSFALDTNDHG